MNAVLKAPTNQAEFEIHITEGPEKGAKFKLSGSPILIGRGKDNHIFLPNDPKISRQHAQIVFSTNGIEILDISGRKRLIVNGATCEKALLINNAKIKIGDSLLVFQIQQNRDLQSIPNQQKPAKGIPKSKSNRKKKAKNGQFQKKLIMYGLIGFLLYFALSETSSKKKAVIELKTEAQFDAEVKKNQEIQDQIIKQKRSKGINTPQYKEAQASFVTGFRDFKNANYASASKSFKSCLIIFPTHKLCNRYAKLSDRKHNELIQYNMVLGKQYKEQGQFQKCAHMYKTVMTLVLDKNNKVYREAKAARNTCLLLTRDNY